MNEFITISFWLDVARILNLKETFVNVWFLKNVYSNTNATNLIIEYLEEFIYNYSLYNQQFYRNILCILFKYSSWRIFLVGSFTQAPWRLLTVNQVYR